jgi:hypothetical protein
LWPSFFVLVCVVVFYGGKQADAAFIVYGVVA